MKSVMSHQFSQVPQVQIPRSSFDRSHGHKTTFDAGYLIPVLCDEALPGDTFNCKMAGFARMSTPLYPVMDNMYLDTQFFSVPIRLIYDYWQRMMGEQINPGDSIDFQVPVMDITKAPLSTTGYDEMSLSDYMGIPTKITDLEHSSLFHRAYNLIYNEWYRDQNLQDAVVVDTDQGPDDPADYVLLRRGKRHDYFTSGLPWPQKGDSVNLPLGTVAPVTGIAPINQTYAVGGTNVYETGASASTTYANQKDIDPSNSSERVMVEEDPNNPGYPNIYADLTNATASTINQLRQAFQIQRLMERDARGGTRYIEIVKSHFGVTSPDLRATRPEYLGGGSTPVNITPVASTNGSIAPTNGFLGFVGGYGTSAINNNGFTKSFTEHCLIIGIASVRADLTYQQGLNRMFSRSTRYDFYFPSLAQIGEQTVLEKEIYALGTAQDEDVFAYQERYAEYRYKPSIITGQLRSNCSTPLDVWHLAQEFSSKPELNDVFIQENPPIDRVVITPSEPHFVMDTYFSMRCARPMPLYGVPGMMDHF